MSRSGGTSSRWRATLGAAGLVAAFAGGQLANAGQALAAVPARSLPAGPAMVAPLVAAPAALTAAPLDWSAPTPIDGQPPYPELDGVSCPSAGLCVAVDHAGNVVTSTDPTAGGDAWSTAPLESTGYDRLGGVSCPSSTLCVIGDYAKTLYVSTDPAAGASTWTPQAGYYPHDMAIPAGPNVPSPSAEVSCATASFCFASLSLYGGETLATSLDPAGGETAWTRHSQSYTGDPSLPPIAGVSCVSVSLCVAVDASGHVLSSTDPASGEAAWTVAPVDSSSLEAVSCPSESLCVAVDGAGNVVSSTDPTGGEPAWSVAGVDGTTKLTGVSCASESLCVAVDAAGNALTSTDPTGGPGAWNAVAVDPRHALTGVSCTRGTAGLCVAVDDTGDAVTSTFSPPSEEEGGHGGGEQGAGNTSGGTRTGAPAAPTGPLPATLASAPTSDAFTIARAKVGNDGRIVLALEAPTAGSFAARATIEIDDTVAVAGGIAVAGGAVVASGATEASGGVVAGGAAGGATVASGARQETTHARAHARELTYGTGAAAVLGAGATTVTLTPTRTALGILKHSRTLRVSVTVVFHPRGGSPTTANETVTARYRVPRPS
jgi:hypothetical protein